MSESLYLTQTHWTMEYKFVYDYDVKEIPLYKNQEGSWRDLELVESIWKMKQDIESPETFSEPAIPTFAQDTSACTPANKPDDISSSGILATPSVSKCFATKNEESISIMKTK